MLTLNAANLDKISDQVERPNYDRSKLKTGIVHFGTGGFHRAHQAMYVDRLMNMGEAFDWGICGIGVMPADQKMRDALKSQDCLYTLVTKYPDGNYHAQVIGSIVDYYYAPDDPERVIEKMASPDTKIVSLTITEGGYNFHHVTGEFDFESPLVAEDLTGKQAPKTVFGLVTEALRRRFERGITPFTIMSCDNIQSNGDVAKKMFSAFALKKDKALGERITKEVAFPNAMVDRITPVTAPADIEEIKKRFGFSDAWPVVCEPFTQWVIEDHFPTGRPAFEKVEVQLVKDVIPYELMKLRLLNASHQALTYFGYLAGYRFAHEVMQDELFRKFLLDYMKKEGEPTLQAVPGIDLTQYQHTLIERFANPEVKDTLARLCAESSDRIPKWLLPVVRKNLATQGEIKLSAAVVASWARYAEGKDEQGNPIEVVDRLKDNLMNIAQNNRKNITAFIENREVFGDLCDNEEFVKAYSASLKNLYEKGAKETVRQLVM